jgi:hypothetical protein
MVLGLAQPQRATGRRNWDEKQAVPSFKPTNRTWDQNRPPFGPIHIETPGEQPKNNFLILGHENLDSHNVQVH